MRGNVPAELLSVCGPIAADVAVVGKLLGVNPGHVALKDGSGFEAFTTTAAHMRMALLLGLYLFIFQSPRLWILQPFFLKFKRIYQFLKHIYVPDSYLSSDSLACITDFEVLLVFLKVVGKRGLADPAVELWASCNNQILKTFVLSACF